MSNTNTNVCFSMNLALNQKKKRALYNVPPTRLTPVSPYPEFTQFQLNMRRKTEILKHENQNSKIKHTTKTQQWSSLATQTKYQKKTTIVCDDLLSRPTYTTACDVPGPPMLLQYDATIPLYNYKNNRVYSIKQDTDVSIYKLFTKNEMLFLQQRQNVFKIDQPFGRQTYTEQVGVIIITDKMPLQTYTFNLTTPIAIWFHGVAYNNEPTANNGLPKYPYFMDDVLNNRFINIKITGVELIVNYSDQRVIVPYNISLDLNDVSLNVSSLNNSFYGMQYVGMLEINNAVIPTQPGFIYDVNLSFTYEYNYGVVQNLQVFQSGVFSNIEQNNQNAQFNCAFSSTPPNNYRSSAFKQYYTTYS